MKQYKGIEIDGAIIKSNADVDAFLKSKAIEMYSTLNAVFEHLRTYEAAAACDEQATRLHDVFGLSYAEIEAL